MMELATTFALPAALALVGAGLAVWGLAQVARDAPALERLKVFLAELARPFSIISTSGSAAFATGVIAWRGSDFTGAAIFIGAVYAGLAGLYGFRAWENHKVQGHAAEVEKVRAQASPPPASALAPPPAEAEPGVASPSEPAWPR